MRPSFEQIYMDLAVSLAARSSCIRAHVGAVITTIDFRKVIAVGYNGNAIGHVNSCDSSEPGLCGCLHAEENAIINCDSPRYIEKVFFCTHLPCKMCAKRIINFGNVKRVIFKETYRKQDGLLLLQMSGIEVFSICNGVLSPVKI